MDIFIGADYKGFEKKNELVKFLTAKNYNVTDVGAYSYNEGDDFNGRRESGSPRIRSSQRNLNLRFRPRRNNSG